MNFHFLSFFLVIAWITPVVPVHGATPFSIRAAVEDELYELAEEQARDALNAEQPPENKAELTLLLARSLIGQNRFDDAAALCNTSLHLPRQDAFRYWKADAQFESGQVETALQTLQNFPQESSYLASALLLRGRAAVSSGNLEAAEKLFEEYDTLFPESEDAAKNLLNLAYVCMERGRSKPAQQALDRLLQRFPGTVEADSGRLLLARELIADGSKSSREKAAKLLRQLGSSDTAHPQMRIAAWVELSGIKKADGQSSTAAEALLRAETLTDETVLKARQQAARANLLLDEEKTDEAFALFDTAVRAAPDPKSAASILVQKAEGLLEQERYAEAETAFQGCLDVTEQAVVRHRALFGMGWCFLSRDRFEEAIAAFNQAAEQNVGTDERIRALIKAGDAFLRAGQFDAAHEVYRKAGEADLRHPLAAQAAYQSGIALVKNDKTDKAFRYFQTVETTFPESEFATKAALRRAEILRGRNTPDEALAEYLRIARHYTNSPVRIEAVLQQGLILFNRTRYDEALAAFNTVLETDPDGDRAAQAFYMRGFCRYLQGNAAEGLNILREFSDQFPGSAWTPEVLFLLAEHAYNTGNYDQARTSFLEIAERFPKHRLSDDALFRAGSARMRQDNFLDAFTLFSRLAGDTPDSELLLQARFAQGEALTELGEFSRAILAYEEIIKTESDSLTADRARGRLADCLFTLGADEPARFTEALEMYQALSQRTGIPYELRLQALCKAARCADKTGNTDTALKHYTEAVYSAGEQTASLSPTAVLWFTRAALEAAELLERQQKPREATHLYDRIIQAEVPAADEAQKRIRKIRKQHPKEF